jgi:TolB-like protein
VVVVGLAHLAVLGGGVEAGATGDPAIALFPPQNRAGDSAAASVLEQTLRAELGQIGSMIGPEATRNALRRVRVRNGDRAAPALLRLVGGELNADWLVSATLHDADRRQVPRLTVSLRVYSSETGELVWAGFQGRSGLDDRKLLGLGVISSLEGLVVMTARKLLQEMQGPGEGTGAPAPPSASRLGTVAIVPFQASTPRRGTLHAETVTEAVRARLVADGVPLVSPNLSHEILRRRQSGRWGGVAAGTREDLRSLGGADTILTGAVESYEVGGSEFEPEPRVAVAMRLLDAASGRILWMGSSEREGGDRPGLFGLGRIYSRGALTARIFEALAKRVDREGLRVIE